MALRDMHGADVKNPVPFFAVKWRIESALLAHVGRFGVVPVPNITQRLLRARRGLQAGVDCAG